MEFPTNGEAVPTFFTDDRLVRRLDNLKMNPDLFERYGPDLTQEEWAAYDELVDSVSYELIEHAAAEYANGQSATARVAVPTLPSEIVNVFHFRQSVLRAVGEKLWREGFAADIRTIYLKHRPYFIITITRDRPRR